jgi:hypothetical protein
VSSFYCLLFSSPTSTKSKSMGQSPWAQMSAASLSRAVSSLSQVVSSTSRAVSSLSQGSLPHLGRSPPRLGRPPPHLGRSPRLGRFPHLLVSLCLWLADLCPLLTFHINIQSLLILPWVQHPLSIRAYPSDWGGGLWHLFTLTEA